MKERLKELDGLRGIAILLVMAFHIFKRAAYFTKNGTLYFISELSYIGWIGVDIFFCLSGFLITSILLKTKADEHFFKNFYARRILRIFPLYYFFIIIGSALLPVFAPDYIPHISAALPFLFTYFQNWMGYFGIPSLPLFLGVTWSLAIEEQFYFIWPSITYYNTKETLLKICAGIISISFITRMLSVLFFSDIRESATFFYSNIFTRFEELVFGAALGVLLSYPDLKGRISSLSLPVFFISFSTFAILCIKLFPGVVPYYSNLPLTLWSYTLIPLFSASLISMLVTYPENSLIRKAFRNQLLLFFGKYSYAMYLLHMPIALLLLGFVDSTHLKGWKIYFAYILLTYALTALFSLITWHLIEKHMLNLKRYFEYK